MTDKCTACRPIDAEHLKRWIIARGLENEKKGYPPLSAGEILEQIERELTFETHDRRTETHSCDYGKKETHGDVISRQVAIDTLKKAYWNDNIQSAKNDPCVIDAMTDWAIRQIQNLPAIIDVEEIVRCPQCKHNIGLNPANPTCNLFYGAGWNNGFCCQGERRTDE